MTKKLYFLILIFFIPICQLFASHSVGADLTYDCLGGNQYRFRLKFYRDCAGISAPTNVTVNLASASCGQNINITMPLISSQEVSPLCAAQLPNSTCNGGSLPGIQQYVYEATYTLPVNCVDWKFSYTLCCRNAAVTNSSSASSYNLYVEANLNNVVVACNSSPDFTVNPVPYICNGQPFSYNHGVVDVDGDSLSYTLIQPKHTAGSNVPYTGSFSSTYPISTSPANNFVFNPSTGQMTFTPNGTQIGLVAIRVDEFRNGVKIGSTIRDMQVIVINCGTNSTPSMANPINVTGASYNTTTSTFKACPGTPMSFQFVSTDLDASQILTLTSNVGTSIPAAVVTSTGTNPKTTTFTWTPTKANAGFYSISFRAVDNACPLTASATKGFNIYVPSLKATISDTMVCTGTGKAFNLNATPTGTDGTETYAWTPAVGFTTSSTIKNPSVNISTPQTYVVSMTQGGCILRDTVRVKPYATLVASPDSSLCPFDPAIQLTSTFTKLMPTLSASPITYSWTPTAGLTPSATISNPSAKPAATTSYILSAGDALCTMKDTVVISVVPCPCYDTARIATPKVLTCTQLLDTLDGSASTTGSSFQWIAYAGGNIVSGATTATPIINQPGRYTLVVTNLINGCKDSTFVIVTRNNIAPNINAGIDTVLNCVRTSLNLSATSSTTGVTYAWSNGANTATASVNAPNTYTVTATNPVNGCTASDAVVVTQNITTPNINAGIDTVLNCIRTSLNLNATSSTTGVTYAWSNGATTASTSVNAPNTYTVTVTNTYNRCTASDAVVVTQNITTPNINAGIDTVLNCIRTSLNLNATSSTTGVTYAWSNGATTATASVNAPNTYTVTATNPVNGCTASDAVVVTQNIIAPNINAGIDTVLNCVRTSLNLSASSSTTGVTYAWSNGATTATASVNAPNTYTVTATNPVNGCTASDAVVVTQNITTPNINAGIDTVLNCIRTSLNLNATSSTTGVTYAWSNGATTAANTTTVPNTYTVTVTNPLNGCTASDAMVISQNITAPIANAGVDTILYCNRTTINWSATSNVAGATYAWSNGATTAANTTTVPNTYTVTVTNPLNGCTASDAMVISQNITAPIANAGVDTILYCNRTTINWSATSNVAGATYAWSNGATTAANTTTAPNTYTVTVTNPLNGCTASDAMVISQNITAPIANAGVDTILYCNRTTINWSATSNVAGATYAWSNGATTAANTTTVPNTYTVTVTNPLNGCTASDAMVISQNITAPIANAGVDTILYCNRTTINWSATSNVAGATYAWSNGATTAANTTTAPNTYTVTVTNPLNGCTASDAMVISQNLTAPGVNAGIDTVVNCVRTSLNLSASSPTAGATFAWSNGATTAITNVSAPTTYTVTATHPVNGCTSTDAVVVGIDTVSPNANAGVDTVINCTHPTISLLGSSSTYGVTVSWTGPGIVSGSNTYSPVINDAGLYTMTITNVVSGCVTTDGVNVSANFIVPNAEAGNLDSVTCADVQINLQGSSITSNVSYSWSGPGIVSGANTSSPLVNTAGLYTLTVTSLTNGCSKTDTVRVVQEITVPQVSAGADTTLTCVRTNLNLTATSSTPSPIGFAWSNGATTAVTNVNTNNTYTVTATNLINGCTVSDAVVVSMDTVAPGVNAGIDTVVNCVRTSLNLSASSPTAGATFAWSNGATTAVTNVSAPTTYTVTATHPVNGCTSTDAVVVGIDTVSPNANAGVDTVINCTHPTISLLGSSSTYGVTVSWTGPGIVSGSNTYSPVVNDAGLYTMTITNVVSGCVTTDGVNVSANFIVPNAEAGNLDSVTCADVQINLQGSSITSNVSYSWSGPGIVSGANTSSPLVNTAGLYTLTVTSLTNGCSKTDTVRVVQEITVPQVSAGADTTLTCVRTNLNLTATSSTPSPIGFAWSNGATTAVTNVNTNNTYTVTATNLINGCTVSDAVVVSMDTVAPGVNAGIDTVVNCVRTSLNLSASSPTAGATFAWSNGATTAVTNVSAPTTYTVTATHPVNGCTSTDAVVVGIDTVSPNANAGVDTVINCTHPTISLLGSSSTYGVTVSWTGPGIVSGSNTYSPVVNDAGLYTMTITNVVSGCVTTDGVNVSANFIVPNAEAGNLDSVTCADVQINLQGSSITSNVSYSWSGPGIVSGANTSSPLVNTAGLYTLTVTSLTNGCSKTDTVRVVQEITVPQVSAGADTTLTCVRTNLNLTATSSTPSPIGFAWSNGATTAVTNVNTNNTYTVTATNLINGCTVSDAVVVSMDTVAPGVNAGIDTVVNCVRTSLNLSASSPTAGATFAWSNGATTAVTNVSAPTTYTVTATHPVNGCTSTDAVVVGIDTVSPNANAGVDTVINCTHPTISLLGSSSTYGVTVSWTGPGIVSGSNTYSPVVNDAGLYTMTITNVVSGCVTTDGVNVSANFIVPNAEAGNLDSVTCADVQINLQGSSITSNVSYSWSGPGIVSGANTSSPLVNTAGLYTLTVTSLTNGCSKTDTVRVVQEITVPQVSAGADTTLTCVRTNLNLTATSSTPSPIGFAWSNGATTAVTNVNTNNTYTVTATNLINGCTVSDAVVVSMDTVAPGVNAGIDTVVNCVRTSLNLSASSPTAGATFAWSNGATTAVTNVSAPTTYTVTATHPVNGCTSTDAVVVGIDTVSPNANAGVDTVINCTHPTISLLGSSSTYGVTVSWTGPGIVSGSNTYSPVVNDAGLYTMTITNVVSGCVTTDGVNVSANFIVPNAEAGNLDSVTCADVQINLQGSSITSNVSYSWSGPGIVSGANTSSPLVNTAGLYTLTVTSLTNGCSKTDTVRVVQEITVPQVSAGADTTLTCVRTNLNLTATSSTPSPIGFAWSNGATTAVTNVNTNNTYTVTATNLINGCTVSDAVVVSMDTVAPGVNAGIDTVVNCVRTSLNLSASSPTAGATFAWSNGATTAVTNVSAPTTYTVTATHPVNGCTSTDAVVVGIDTVSPNANAGVDTVINCTHPTISLLGSSSTYGVTVSWTGPGIVSGSNTYSPVVNDAGLYTMTITNVVSGCVTTDGVNVSANFIVPNAEAGNLDSVTCADVQINLQGSSITSNVSYSWSGPGIVSGANTSSPLVNTAGLYTLTVTSLTNGCSKTDTVRVVQEITVPQVSAGADTTLTCVRTNLNLTATSSTPSPIGFAWSNGATTAVTNVNTNNTYTVTATNLINGCTVSDAVVVNMDTVAPVLNAGLDTILNCVRRNLNLQASSNIAGATYQWSNGVSGIINPITTPNIYRVTATHPTNGCISTDAVIVVIDTTTPNINAGLDTTLKCYRRSVVLNATSTVPNMNYVWSNGTVGASNTVSAANMYTVIGQNPVNGCVNRDAVIVNVDTVAPNANAGPDKIVNCIKTSETLNASSTTPNVTFLWSNGTATAANTVSTTIAYTVTVTNPINGCTASDVAVLTTDTAAPGANAGADKDLTCTITSVSFTATSPTPNVSFQWSNGTTGQNITVSIPNTYAVTVTSLGNGCTSTDAVNANLVPPPTITYDVLDNPCPQVAKGHIVPMISGGKAPFTYTWNNGSHASALSGLHGGGYAVTITDANGCVITDTFNLVEKQFILDVTADQTEIELGEEVHFNSNITGGTGMESLTWNPGIFLSCDTCKNPTAGPMKSVKYNIVAVDTNGCSSTDTISIQVTPKYDLFVPNAFSPNNDGSNDVYEIFGNKKIWAEVEFKIFNRWGELIFESRDHEFKWDGTFKGELLTPQVVVYEFKVVYVDGYSAPTQKGSITIIR